MGTDKKQKRARNGARKNRYCAGAKLSEHKFLRILRGYAEGLTITELQVSTHVSGKTIRATYQALRERLAFAVFEGQENFGRAGSYLSAPGAEALLEAMKAGRLFKQHRKRHAPRLRCSQEERLLVIELTVRLFWALDLRNCSEAGPEQILKAIASGLSQLKSRAALQHLADFIPGAKPFAHPGLRFYEDYRRYLLRNPLRARMS